MCLSSHIKAALPAQSVSGSVHVGYCVRRVPAISIPNLKSWVWVRTQHSWGKAKFRKSWIQRLRSGEAWMRNPGPGPSGVLELESGALDLQFEIL